MSGANSSPRIPTEIDPRPSGTPEDAGLPLRAAEHVEAEGRDDSRNPPLTVEDGRMVSTTDATADLIERDAAIASGQPASDVTGAGDLETLLLREQLSAGNTSDGRDEPKNVGNTQHVGRHLSHRDHGRTLRNNWHTPKRLRDLDLRLNRWRARLDLRRARRKEARLHLSSVPHHLGNVRKFTDGQGGAGSHLVDPRAIGLSDRAQLVETAGDQPSAFSSDGGGDLVPAVAVLLHHIDATMSGDEADLTTVSSGQHMPEGRILGTVEGAHRIAPTCE